MRNLSNLGRGVALAALLAVSATPALAEGKHDRAKEAIAEAHGKVDAAEKAGTMGEVPGITARANASLRAAEEDLSAGHKTAAIQAANHASELADTAIGVANKQRNEHQAAVAADAAARTDAAQQQAAAAQGAAASANDRAAAAEQSAAVANAQADALRNQPAPAPTVATVTTTETTKHVASSGTAKKLAVRRPVTRPATRAATATERTTTTTVSTAPATGS